jgi:hypothetical protein
MKKIILLVINFAIFFMLVSGVEAGWKDTWDSFGKSVNKSIKDLNQAIGSGTKKTKDKTKELQRSENPNDTPYPPPNQSQSGWQVYPKSQEEDTSRPSSGGDVFVLSKQTTTLKDYRGANREPISSQFAWLNGIHFMPELLSDDTLNQMTGEHVRRDRAFYSAKSDLERDLAKTDSPPKRFRKETFARKYKNYKPFFDENQVKGRSLQLAIPELAPVVRSKLLEVAATAPRHFIAEQLLFSGQYDPSSGLLPINNCDRYRKKCNSYFLAPQTKYYEKDFKKERLPEPIRDKPIYTIPATRSKPLPNTGGKGPWGEPVYRIGLWTPKYKIILPTFFKADLFVLDHWLESEGIPLSKEQANDFLYKIERGWRLKSVVDFTVTGATTRKTSSSDKKDRGVVLLAKLNKITILLIPGKNQGSIPKVMANLSPDYFPTAEERAAQLMTALNKEQRKNNLELQKRIEEDRLKKESQMRSKEERREREARINRMSSKRTRDRIESHKKNTSKSVAAFDLKKSCQRKYKTAWSPRKGTPEYEEAVATCLNAPRRETYGPNIVGLQLGMESKEARSIVINELGNNEGARLKKARPFEGGMLRWTEDANRGIALFYINNNDRNLVAGVSRRIYFGDNGPAPTDIIDGLRKKYGAETWSDGDRALVWAFPTGSEITSTNGYADLVEQLAPRANWTGPWKPRGLTGEEKLQSMQKESENAENNLKCVQNIMNKLGSVHGGSGENEYMKVFNEEKAICDQKFGPKSPTQKTGGPRLPLMIRAEGNPGVYAQYKASGPVVIVLINKDVNDQVKDASFILFDPAWMASQPAFVFESGAGSSGAQAEIKF